MAGCATPKTQFRESEPGVYEITKRSELLSVRSGELKIRADLEALAYCRDQGKALSTLDARLGDPDPPDYAFATVQFRCVPR